MHLVERPVRDDHIRHRPIPARGQVPPDRLGTGRRAGHGPAGGVGAAPVPPMPARLGGVDKEGQAEEGHDQGMDRASHESPHNTQEKKAGSPSICGPLVPTIVIPGGGGGKSPHDQKRKAAAESVCHGLPVYRACCPPASGVEKCETGANRATLPIPRVGGSTAFQGSGPTLLVWHLRRYAVTGRMSVPITSSGRPTVLQKIPGTATHPLSSPRLGDPGKTHEHPMLLPQLWQR